MELKSTFSSVCLEDYRVKLGGGSPKGLNFEGSRMVSKRDKSFIVAAKGPMYIIYIIIYL